MVIPIKTCMCHVVKNRYLCCVSQHDTNTPPVQSFREQKIKSSWLHIGRRKLIQHLLHISPITVDTHWKIPETNLFSRYFPSLVILSHLMMVSLELHNIFLLQLIWYCHSYTWFDAVWKNCLVQVFLCIYKDEQLSPTCFLQMTKLQVIQ